MFLWTWLLFDWYSYDILISWLFFISSVNVVIVFALWHCGLCELPQNRATLDQDVLHYLPDSVSCQPFHTHLSIVWGAAFDEGHLNDNLYHCDKPSSKKHYKDCFVCIINHENTPIQIVFCVKRSNTHFNVSELKNENGDFVL